MSKKEVEARHEREQKIKLKNTADFIRMFASRPDNIKEYTGDSEIYFEPTKNGKYLVVNHFNTKKKPEFQGYDLWIAEYANRSDIGELRAISKTCIKQGFDITTDKEIIDQYLSSHFHG